MATSSTSAAHERPRARKSGSDVLRKTMAAAVSTETILDLVERLGLFDLIVDRLRVRLESTDIDEILDEVTDYLKRNPEVIVVALGTITVMAGVLVYLERREHEEAPRWRGSAEDDEEETPRPRPAARTTPPRRKAS